MKATRVRFCCRMLACMPRIVLTCQRGNKTMTVENAVSLLHKTLVFAAKITIAEADNLASNPGPKNRVQGLHGARPSAAP